MKRVELLAPAGSTESFRAAINAGADAVYLAGTKYGARAYADNFTTEKIIESLKIAHILGRRIYLTVNTLVKETELAELQDYIEPLYNAGLDGVIIQDPGVFSYIRDSFPGMELHVSTQMSLCTSAGAAFMKQLGACRIVPAREISLNEIRRIKEETDIEIEAFIHGAMCYCYSGQCLFSSILGGRSGNRGRCAQPCRLPYKVQQTTGHFLSLKDMCTLKDIPALIDAGIDSFKIEGRMKRPEYAAGVTGIYRKYIDLYYKLCEKHGFEKAKELYKIDSKDQQLLEALYIRSEIQNGYYYKHNGRDMITLQSPAYRETSDLVLLKLKEQYLEHDVKAPLSVFAYFYEGSPAGITVSYGEHQVYVEGEIVESAQNQPISEENIRKQLSKLGDTCFYAKDIQIELSDNAFYSLKQLNALRRAAIDELQEKLLHPFDRSVAAASAETPQTMFVTESSSHSAEGNAEGYRISVRTMEQLSAVVNYLHDHTVNLNAIYIDADLYTENNCRIERLISKVPGSVKLLLNLPYVYREKSAVHFETYRRFVKENSRVDGLLIHSVDELGLLSGEFSGQVHADAGIYVWNTGAVKILKNKVDSFCIPYELNSREQFALPVDSYNFAKVIYGRIPMMITANCIRKTNGACSGTSSEPIQLIDRYNIAFPVVTDCKHCYNILYNSLPLSLHKEIGKWENKVSLRIDFSVENASETEQVLTFLLSDRGLGTCPYEYTTGHEKRGVE